MSAKSQKSVWISEARRSFRSTASSRAACTAAGASFGSSLIAFTSFSERAARASRAALIALPAGLRPSHSKQPSPFFAIAAAIWRPENLLIAWNAVSAFAAALSIALRVALGSTAVVALSALASTGFTTVFAALRSIVSSLAETRFAWSSRVSATAGPSLLTPSTFSAPSVSPPGLRSSTFGNSIGSGLLPPPITLNLPCPLMVHLVSLACLMP